MLCIFGEFDHGSNEMFLTMMFWGANGANKFTAVLAARRDNFVRMGLTIHKQRERLLIMGLSSNDKNNKNKHKK